MEWMIFIIIGLTVGCLLAFLWTRVYFYLTLLCIFLLVVQSVSPIRFQGADGQKSLKLQKTLSYIGPFVIGYLLAGLIKMFNS